MFARLTIVQVNVDKLDEAKKIYEESLIPAAKSQKGYRVRIVKPPWPGNTNSAPDVVRRLIR